MFSIFPLIFINFEFGFLKLHIILVRLLTDLYQWLLLSCYALWTMY